MRPLIRPGCLVILLLGARGALAAASASESEPMPAAPSERSAATAPECGHEGAWCGPQLRCPKTSGGSQQDAAAAVSDPIQQALMQAQSGSPTARRLGGLGNYERADLERGLARLGRRIDSDPEGKTVRAICVVNLPVFGADAGPLQMLDVFHVTTKPGAVAREVLLESGAQWSWARAAETERNLRNPIFTQLAVVVPLATGVANTVDVGVITRDVWSLRTNSSFELQNDVLTELALSLTENNLLGRRKQLALAFAMDRGSLTFAPIYFDERIAGSRWQLAAQAGPILTRASGRLEGSRSRLSLAYPLYALARRWGASFSFSHFDGVQRVFVQDGLRTYDAPQTAENDAVPWRYLLTDIGARASGVFQTGAALKHRVRVGYAVDLVRPRIPPGARLTPEVAKAFRRDVLPRSELASGPFVRYRLFEPRFIKYRDLDSFDLPEDRRLGPELNVELRWAHAILGAQRNFARLSLDAGWTFDVLQDGFVAVDAGAGLRVGARGAVDRRYSASVKIAAPILWHAVRGVADARIEVLQERRDNRFLVLGGESGLRGFPVGAFWGSALVATHLELRSTPIRMGFVEAGAVGFWELGHVASRLANVRLQQDVGVGVRLVIPQAQPSVIRIDWAVPLTGAGRGFPGRLTAAFGQVF